MSTLRVVLQNKVGMLQHHYELPAFLTPVAAHVCRGTRKACQFCQVASRYPQRPFSLDTGHGLGPEPLVAIRIPLCSKCSFHLTDGNCMHEAFRTTLIPIRFSGAVAYTLSVSTPTQFGSPIVHYSLRGTFLRMWMGAKSSATVRGSQQVFSLSFSVCGFYISHTH